MEFNGHPLQVLTLTYLVENGRVLMLKRNADKRILPSVLTVPGGKVEPQEDVYSSAVREYEEEAGLTPLNLNLRGTYTFTTDDPINQGGVIYIFTADAFRGTFSPDSPDGELVWCTPDEILASPDVMADHKQFIETLFYSEDHICCMGQWKTYQKPMPELLQWADSRSYFAQRKALEEAA